MNTKKCDYGCGQDSTFLLKNGKNCCSPHWTKCPVNRSANSIGLKRAYKRGAKTYIFTDEHRKIARDNVIKETTKNLFVKGVYHSPSLVKQYLIDHIDIPKKCFVCGIKKWRKLPVKLEMHHIDGDKNNNLIENLELLCPNCHSMTDNWRGNKSTGFKKVSDKCLIDALKRFKTIHRALIKVGLTPKGANYERAYKLKKTIDDNKDV